MPQDDLYLNLETVLKETSSHLQVRRAAMSHPSDVARGVVYQHYAGSLLPKDYSIEPSYHAAFEGKPGKFRSFAASASMLKPGDANYATYLA